MHLRYLYELVNTPGVDELLNCGCEVFLSEVFEGVIEHQHEEELGEVVITRRMISRTKD